MTTIKLKGGLLYQWDTDRRVEFRPWYNYTVDEVHFGHEGDPKALVVEVTEENGVLSAKIPDILLQSPERIMVYAIYHTNDGERTYRHHTLDVIARPKPEDYIYTEEEVKKWEDLNERITALEENSSDDMESLALLIETDMLPAVHDVNGKILTDENGKIILRY